MPASVADLLTAGRLEHVPADPATARTRLERAEQHLTTAASLVDVDNEVAYASLYDAVRKAVTAHMLANGLRALGRPRAHEAVGDYAIARIPDPSGAVDEFHRLRKRRNRSEYDDMVFGRLDVEHDLEVASRIVAAVRSDL